MNKFYELLINNASTISCFDPISNIEIEDVGDEIGDIIYGGISLPFFYEMVKKFTPHISCNYENRTVEVDINTCIGTIPYVFLIGEEEVYEYVLQYMNYNKILTVKK